MSDLKSKLYRLLLARSEWFERKTRGANTATSCRPPPTPHLKAERAQKEEHEARNFREKMEGGGTHILSANCNIAAGGAHSIAFSYGTGKIVAFGQGKHGQLGTGTVSDNVVPIMVAAQHSGQGEEVAWNDREQNVVHVACGNNHSALLTDRGRLYMWGRNNKTQLARHNDDATNVSAWVPNLVKIPGYTHEILHIACGVNYSAAVTSNFDVFTWGSGVFGNLGHGDTKDRSKPELVRRLIGASIVTLAAGSKHMLALSHSGEVWSWGHGDNGRLGLASGDVDHEGHGGLIGHLEPSMITSFRAPVIAVATGEAHSVAITVFGELFTWGAGSYGRLGHGFDHDELSPKRVENLPAKLSSVACGVLHTVAMTDSGALWVFGGGQYGQLGLSRSLGHQRLPIELQSREIKFKGFRVRQVACGDFHTVVVAENPDIGLGLMIMTWGFGAFGRLGRGGGFLSASPLPEKVDMVGSLLLTPNVQRDSGTQRDAQGEEAGKGAAGAMSISVEPEKTSFRTVIVGVACGALHSGAFTLNGRLFMWGCNEFGQLGDDRAPYGQTTPMENISRTRRLRRSVKSLVCGREHTIAITIENQVYAWGRGSDHRLGTSGAGKVNQLPMLIEAFRESNIVSVQAGDSHSAATGRHGELYTWGSGHMGKLGHGRDMLAIIPRRIDDALQGVRVAKCALGLDHTVVVTEAGVVFTWGAGWYGRLGHGSTSNEYSPRQVCGVLEGHRCTDIAAGAYHTVAISAGDLYVWGRNEGRLGVGESAQELLPMRNEPLRARGEELISCTAGENHTIVVTKKGGVISWGSVSFSKLGHEFTLEVTHPSGEVGDVDRYAPPDMVWQGGPNGDEGGVETLNLNAGKPFWEIDSDFSGVPDIRFVSTRSNHNIALSVTGHVFVWGARGSGRLGLDWDEGDPCVSHATVLGCPDWDTRREGSAAKLAETDAKDTTEGKRGMMAREPLGPVLKHLQRSLQTEPMRQRIRALESKLRVNHERRVQLLADFTDDLQPRMIELAQAELQVGMLVRLAMEKIYNKNSTAVITLRSRAQAYVDMTDTFENIVSILSAHPLAMDAIHKFVFPAQKVTTERFETVEQQQDWDLLRDHDRFTELIFAIYGGVVEERMQHLFLRFLEMLLRRELGEVSRSGETDDLKTFGDVNSTFGRLTYVYFRSHHIMGSYALRYSKPMKVFLSKKLDLETSPNAVWALIAQDLSARQSAFSEDGMELYTRHPDLKAEVDARITLLRQHATDWVALLLNGLVDVPVGVCYVCRAISNAVKEHYANQALLDGGLSEKEIASRCNVLVGKFLALHLFRPILQFPKQYGVLWRTYELSHQQQLNLRRVMQVVFRCLTNSPYPETTPLRELNPRILELSTKCTERIGRFLGELDADYLSRSLLDDMFTLHLRLEPLQTTVALGTLSYLVEILHRMHSSPDSNAHGFLFAEVEKLKEAGWLDVSSTGGSGSEATTVQRLNLNLTHTFGEAPAEFPTWCGSCDTAIARCIAPHNKPLKPLSANKLFNHDGGVQAFKTTLTNMVELRGNEDSYVLRRNFVDILNNERMSDSWESASKTKRGIAFVDKMDAEGEMQLFVAAKTLVNVFGERTRMATRLETESVRIDRLRAELETTAIAVKTRTAAVRTYCTLLRNGLAGESNRINARSLSVADGEKALTPDNLLAAHHTSSLDAKLQVDKRVKGWAAAVVRTPFECYHFTHPHMLLSRIAPTHNTHTSSPHHCTGNSRSMRYVLVH